MISPRRFVDTLTRAGVSFFTGVPDSLLIDFCAYIADHASRRHIGAANEGGAIALAAGHYLATKEIACVYLQNSGAGNAVNPLASLADPDVYGIPMLIIIGWRGKPGVNDEPQHKKQGKITLKLLDVLEVPYSILPRSERKAFEVTRRMIRRARRASAPAALIVEEGTFESYKSRAKKSRNTLPSREQALEIILSALKMDDPIISTTGKTSREVFEIRELHRQRHTSDFLVVGSMGHASSIALAVARARPRRQVFCLDGDGAVIMHMGALAINGVYGSKNFKHIVLNNAAHESVGGQPTVADRIDIPRIAKACGYRTVLRARTFTDLRKKIHVLRRTRGPALLEVCIAVGSRPNLGRPTLSPKEIKNQFMKFLRTFPR